MRRRQHTANPETDICLNDHLTHRQQAASHGHFTRERPAIPTLWVLVLPWLVSPLVAVEVNRFEWMPDALVFRNGDRVLRISILAPRLTVGDEVTEPIPATSPPGFDLSTGKAVEIAFPSQPLRDGSSLEVRLLVQWTAAENIVHKWIRCRLIGGSSPILLKEVLLDELRVVVTSSSPTDLPPAEVLRSDSSRSPQSYPVFLPGFFVGIEYPIATTRAGKDRIILAHQPGIRLKPGEWYQSHKAVYGAAPLGKQRRAFTDYIGRRRPNRVGLHVNYNSWWTAPVPYSEKDILDAMAAFDENMTRPYGVAFDTFCIDLGWSDTKSMWGIDRRQFPEGFSRIRRAAERMKSRLGLWLSPSNCYAPLAMDNEWAAQSGYETFVVSASHMSPRFVCLGGPRYAGALRDRMVEMATCNNVRQFKFDGYHFECPESTHGHEPGPLSREAKARGIIEVFQAIRAAAPDAWLETTCFGWNPSPWWLLYADSVIGTFGDDAPYGRVPCPIYRESYTTARDYFNLQGAHHLAIPIAAQEVLGIIHQSPEPFMNDAVTTILRGHQFLPVYVNPKYMDKARWKRLARVLAWARSNAEILADTEIILPKSWTQGQCPAFTAGAAMPREPYGYRHPKGNRELILLRNPWIARQEISIPLAPSKMARSVHSLYPEVRRYNDNLPASGAFTVSLAPFETVVLSVGQREWLEGMNGAVAVPGDCVDVQAGDHELVRVELDGERRSRGPDWTNLMGGAESGIRLRWSGSVAVREGRAELLVLLEGRKPVAPPYCRLIINEQPAVLGLSDSETGWSAAGGERPEHWLYLKAPLAAGRQTVSLELLAGSEDVRISVWAWAMRSEPRGPRHFPNVLPSPESISLDSEALVLPTESTSLTAPAARAGAPVERISGIYLDAMEHISAQQGWGTLQRNRGMLEGPLVIAGNRYYRGLGTHAPSRIEFPLDGAYRRFQSWVGADAATNPTIAFEVWIDGRKRWESGLMSRQDEPKWVDLDISGALTLELIVTEGGNGFISDHADWAEARLLR